MITQFDKVTCRLLATEVEAALAAVAAKHGLVATYGGGKFSEAEFTAKVKFTLAASNPAAADAERAEFAKYCHFYGLTPDQYGAEIQSRQHGTLTVIGFAPNRPKFPVKARCADGTVRLFQDAILTRITTAA